MHVLDGTVVCGFGLSPPDAQLLLLCHSLRMSWFCGCHFFPGRLHTHSLSCWGFWGAPGFLAVSPDHLVATAISQQPVDDCSPENHVLVS